jgi:hypothetical protein
MPVVRLKFAAVANALVSCCALTGLLELKTVMIPNKAAVLTQPVYLTVILLVPSRQRVSFLIAPSFLFRYLGR